MKIALSKFMVIALKNLTGSSEPFEKLTGSLEPLEFVLIPALIHRKVSSNPFPMNKINHVLNLNHYLD